MPTPGYTLFDTAIGRCAVAWGERGITGVELPQPDDCALHARIARRAGGAPERAPPPEVAAAVAAMVALLAGEVRDLSEIRLDMTGVPTFHRSVFIATRGIPAGETRTYGEIAAMVGEPGAARAVGQALGRNPFPIVVPCHRVLAAAGKAGGFSATGGLATKMRMLTIERARTSPAPPLFADLPLAAPDRTRVFRRRSQTASRQ